MKNKLPISILICSKDRPEKLKSCVKSIFAQEILPEEIIIVDSSKKNIGQKYWDKKYGRGRVIYLNSKIESIPNSRNILISKAKNNLCIFVDDDVILDKKAVLNCHQSFKNNPNAVIIAGVGWPQKINNIYSQANFKLVYDEFLKIKGEIVPVKYCPTMIFGFQKNIFQKHKIYFNLDMKAFEDVDLCLNLGLAGEKLFIDKRILGSHDYRSSIKSFYRCFYNFYFYAIKLFKDRQINCLQIKNLISIDFWRNQKLSTNGNLLIELWLHLILQLAKAKAIVDYNKKIYG